MKRSKLLLLLIIISALFINIDVNAETLSCSDGEREKLLNHFDIKSSYNSKTKEVELKVKNGSFLVTHIDGDSIIDDSTKPSKETGEYEGISYSYYAFSSDPVLTKTKSVKFKVKSGGTINIGLSFFKSSNKDTKDSGSGCYSFDYWKKYKDTKNINTFETAFKHNGKTEYIEITVPSKPVNEMKTNSNKNTFCKAITNGENYNNKFDSTVIGYWSNDSKATEFYKSMIGDCWKDQVIYVYSEKQIISMIENTLKLWHNNQMAADTGVGKDEAWSINFENVKKAAIDAGHAYYAENSDKGSDFFTLVGTNGKGAAAKIEGLKCDYKSNLYYYKTDASGKVIMEGGKPVYNIDANVSNYYAINSTEKTVTYTYHYTGDSSFDNQDTEEKTVCTVSCEEAVEVKYGPPVASKAGLCFEYQVQVTSRVKCDSAVNPNGKPRQDELCSPVPYCNRVPGYTHQGGPVDDYDQCINECDGGKYTKECSNKCYKKVYGSISGASKTAVDKVATGVIKKLSATGTESFVQIDNGLYIRNSSNDIYWRKNKAGDDAVGYARYYLEGSQKARTLSDHGAYKYDTDGFKRAVYSGGAQCNDYCYFTDCDLHTYLNPGEAESDYAANLEIYNNAIAECKLAASCTEKTATFKINVDYDQKVDGKVVRKTVKYDDSSFTDPSLTSGEAEAACSSNPTIPASNNILLNYQGCYKNCGVGRQYHARWSFPGTWFSMKTGEMSYVSKTDKSWYAETDKFCSPTFAENVNEKWWNYYLHNNMTALTELGIDPDKYSSQCSSGNGTIKSPLSVDKVEPKNDDYNIRASTKNFGYFGWNFSIKCFYALNDCGNVTFSNYRVRSVDSENLFPSADGSELSDVATTGRSEDEIGFNWTSASTTSKNPGYLVNPPKLISIIQSQAAGGKEAIYTDENLDYLFNLTPSNIKELRGVKDYNLFSQGKYMKPGKASGDAKNGVARYYSDIITQYADSNYRPSEEAVQCNNIKNLSTGECDNYVR